MKLLGTPWDPKTCPKASFLKDLGHNLCIPTCFLNVLMFFLCLYIFHFFAQRCRRCSHPAQTSGANPNTSRSQHHLQNQHHQQHQTQQASLANTGRNKHHQRKTPAEPASKAEASIISKIWQKQASPIENPRRTSINTRSQHH
jgi:hypothetical protein